MISGLIAGFPNQTPAPYRWVPSTSRYAMPYGNAIGPESSIAPNGATVAPFTHLIGPSWQAFNDYLITGVRVVVTTALASNSCRVGLVEVGSDDQPSSLVADFGVIDASSIGDKDITGFQVRIRTGRFYASILTRYGGGGSIALRAWPVSYGHFGQDTTTPNRVLQTRSGTSSQTSSTAGYPQVPAGWDTVTAGGANNLAGPLEWMLHRREALTR